MSCKVQRQSILSKLLKDENNNHMPMIVNKKIVLRISI
jgi:hypothetical protein